MKVVETKSITKMKNYSLMIYRWSTILQIGSTMPVTIYYRSNEWTGSLKYGQEVGCRSII